MKDGSRNADEAGEPIKPAIASAIYRSFDAARNGPKPGKATNRRV
jgi:hypothetical protein